MQASRSDAPHSAIVAHQGAPVVSWNVTSEDLTARVALVNGPNSQPSASAFGVYRSGEQHRPTLGSSARSSMLARERTPGANAALPRTRSSPVAFDYIELMRLYSSRLAANRRKLHTDALWTTCGVPIAHKSTACNCKL